jgi:P-type E1-E2 ATPase
VCVLARMSPGDKGDVVKHLREKGAMALMCGDGGNVRGVGCAARALRLG